MLWQVPKGQGSVGTSSQNEVLVGAIKKKNLFYPPSTELAWHWWMPFVTSARYLASATHPAPAFPCGPAPASTLPKWPFSHHTNRRPLSGREPPQSRSRPSTLAGGLGPDRHPSPTKWLLPLEASPAHQHNCSSQSQAL